MKHLSFTKITLVALALVAGFASLAAPATASAVSKNDTTYCVERQFNEGMKNDKCIGYIQQMLNKMDSAKLKVDKKYGPLTAQAVTNWQNDMREHRSMKIDGIVGDQTWRTLCAEQAEYKSLAKSAGCGKNSNTNRTDSYRDCTDQTFSTSKNNVKSDCIETIHNMLNIIKGIRLDPNGRYDSKTSKAVRTIQKEQNVTDDSKGTIGANTWGVLCDYDMDSDYGQRVYDWYAKEAGCNV